MAAPVHFDVEAGEAEFQDDQLTDVEEDEEYKKCDCTEKSKHIGKFSLGRNKYVFLSTND